MAPRNDEHQGITWPRKNDVGKKYLVFHSTTSQSKFIKTLAGRFVGSVVPQWANFVRCGHVEPAAIPLEKLAS